MKPLYAFVLVATLMLGASGCVSTPKNRFYTLDMTPSGKIQTAPALQIELIRPIEMLNRREILVRKSPTEIEYYAGACWASAINELVSQKLKAEWGEGTKADHAIVVWGTLLECGQVEESMGSKAHLRLQLMFRPKGTSRYDTPLFEKVYDVTKPVSRATPDQVAVALTRCLEEMARQITDDVAAHQTASPK